MGWDKVFIASSITEKLKDKYAYACVSVPSIDNRLCFCGCRTVHDGYEWDRQQKVAYLVSRFDNFYQPLKLRVCWESGGGENCSHCEKCYRTILELVSEGADPNEYGFAWDIEAIRRCKYEMLYEIKISNPLIEFFISLSREDLKRTGKRSVIMKSTVGLSNVIFQYLMTRLRNGFAEQN